MAAIYLDNKIGEGRYRNVFQIDDGRCAKILKRKITKDYGLFSLSFPMRWYNFFKFRTSDFNTLELQNYRCLMRQIPEEAQTYFARVENVVQVNGRSASLCRLVRDYDGSISPPLKEFGHVEDQRFWDAINTLRELFVRRGIPYFGVHNANVLVQNNGEQLKPVFIDYKRFGIRTFPFQLWTHLPGEKRRKLNRLFSRLQVYTDQTA